MLPEIHNKLGTMVITRKNENYTIIYIYMQICMSPSDLDNFKTTNNKNNSK